MPYLHRSNKTKINKKRTFNIIQGLHYNIKNKLQGLRLGRVLVENSGNIGKSYRRHDEVGTPICITVDFQTLEAGTVTIRDRDTMHQKRLSPDELKIYYQKYFD